MHPLSSTNPRILLNKTKWKNNIGARKICSASGNGQFFAPLMAESATTSKSPNFCRTFSSSSSEIKARISEISTENSATNRSGVGSLENAIFNWFDEMNGIHKALHSFNRVRVPWIIDHLAPKSYSEEEKGEHISLPLRGFRLLDVGCGGGILSMALVRLGASVVGVDMDFEAIEVARRVSQQTLPPDILQNVKFVHSSIEQLPIDTSDGSSSSEFDALIASEVVEHVENVSAFVAGCVERVKPKGRIFFTTINRTVLSNLLAIKVAEDLLGLLPKGLHSFDHFVRPEELKRALLDSNCRVGPPFGLLYNPLFNSWTWSNFTEVNYAVVATKQ